MLTFPSPPVHVGDDYVLDGLFGTEVVRVRISRAAIQAFGLSACKSTAREKFAASGMQLGVEVRVELNDFVPVARHE